MTSSTHIPTLIPYKFLIAFIGLFGTLLLHAGPSMAQAPLFISPQRVELFDQRRSEVLTATNRTENTASYELGLEDYSMSEQGTTMRVERLEHSARRMVRFSPRSFTLQPGKTQTIRVVSRRPNQLDAGTYRTHVVFREVPNPSAADDKTNPTTGNMSFGIGFQFNIAIPIVVTAGKAVSSVMVEGAEILPGSIVVQLTRDGNADAVFRLHMHLERPSGEKEEIITDNVIRIYRERDWVKRSVVVVWPGGEVATSGNLIITLTPAERNETDVLDEHIVPLS